ncbi:hypothetical protein [Ureibacillus sinduriensis]|uniref:DUF4030 domain-containing protein n=1 Tax=Ureibacillus sinduriensis BLB-1 = JCM 15800 TaxID=1384057 RepID=A0A0A3HVD5_9BACL|nr:hypothetical protein [Ureibacillus sinduriensis]KGR76389.1 hypothetical protein CD33_07580 [Ureibacillus sinduriensis BLB-1 = JCM 15800]
MFKKIMMVAGIFIMGIASLILLSMPLAFNTPIVNKEEQKPLLTQEESTLKMVIEKLQEKYVGVDVKTTSNKELMIHVVGDEEYLNSVKRDMEYIARSIIKSSILKEYSIVFKRWDLIGGSDKIPNKELDIIKTLMKGLRDYDVIDNISIYYQETTITIRTSIKSSNENANKLAMKIEESANEILQSNELKSLSNIDSYKIEIMNTRGKEIN